MPLWNIDESIGLVAPFVGQHKGDHSSDIGLESQHHQISHQTNMLFVDSRNTRWCRVVWGFYWGQLLGSFDPQFDITNRGKVLVELSSIVGRKSSRQDLRVLANKIEDALAPRVPLGLRRIVVSTK